LDKTDLSLVKGVGKISAERLQAGGITTIYRLSKSSVEKIAEVTGFPPVRAALIRTAAQELLESAKPDTPPEAEASSVAKPEKEKAKKKEKTKKSKKKKAAKKSKKKPDTKKDKKGKKGKKKKSKKK
jgi:predicted RecB family nuclease